jgi:hypothetical protein
MKKYHRHLALAKMHDLENWEYIKTDMHHTLRDRKTGEFLRGLKENAPPLEEGDEDEEMDDEEEEEEEERRGPERLGRLSIGLGIRPHRWHGIGSHY